MSSMDADALTIQLEDSRDVQMHFEVEKSANFVAVFDQYSKMKDYSREFVFLILTIINLCYCSNYLMI